MQYVTIDETRNCHYIPESNLATGEGCPKLSKQKKSAGKILASVFWNPQGINSKIITKKKRKPSLLNITWRC